MADRSTMTVRRTIDPNLAALNEMLSQRSGLFLVSVHNYRIQKVARVEKEMRPAKVSLRSVPNPALPARTSLCRGGFVNQGSRNHQLPTV